MGGRHGLWIGAQRGAGVRGITKTQDARTVSFRGCPTLDQPRVSVLTAPPHRALKSFPLFPLLLLGCVLAALPGSAFGQAADDSLSALQAHRLADDERIDLDGRIAEEAWSQALPIDDFTQQEPVEGARPSRRTEIRIVYDEDRLYIGAILYDDPEGVIAYQKRRDALLYTDDRFMWILDTFQDGRTGYFFETNPNGMRGDALLVGGSTSFFRSGGRAWNGIWDVRTARRPDGWSLEASIPFRTLNFDPGSDEWGINFQRTIRRDNEEILWRGWRRNEGLLRPIFAGKLTGLEGMSQGVGLEAVPSAIGSWRNTPANDDPVTYPGDVSLDLNYSVTPSLRASLSFNTDFAEVESDQRRVNLTRFPLRFPEQRGFFLEGAGIFSFAPRSNPTPFFSRNIGLVDGKPVPIDYGVRMTGQAGRTDVGFFQVGVGDDRYRDEDGEDVAVPSEQFTVARVRHPVFEQSTIGAIYTRRATSEDAMGFAPETAHTFGVDMQLATRHFLGDKNAEVELFAVANSNVDPDADKSLNDLSARGLRLNFPNDIWSGHVSYREFGADYDPQAGFVRRNNFRRVEPRINWQPRPAWIKQIRQLGFGLQYRHLVAMDTGVPEEREWEMELLGIAFESGDNVSVELTRRFEELYDRFEVSDGVDIFPGGYTVQRYSVGGYTAGRRKISVYGGVEWGGFWDGSSTEVDVRATFRPNAGVSVGASVGYNDVDLPRGAFSANVYELETEWDPTPDVSAIAQIQYDDVSERVGVFARLRWIVRPGSNIFLVYRHNWENRGAGLFDNRDLVTVSQGASFKLNYTYRL